MHFIISSNTLLKNLNIVSGVISANTVLPILEDFLFEIKNNELSITGSDLETRIQVTVPIQLDVTNSGANLQDHKWCITSKIILDYLKNLPDQPLAFHVLPENNLIELTSNSGKYKIQGQSATEYPKAPEVNNASSLQMPSQVLIEAISYTIFATSNDTLRPAMTGVLFDFTEDGTVFVATDAHKLIRLKRMDIIADKPNAIIVPRKPLIQLRNVLPNDDSAITLNFNETHLYVQHEGITLSSRLIDSKFPPYNSVIPADPPFKLTMNKAELLSALKRVSIFASKGTSQVVFDIQGNSITISAQDVDFSYEGHESLNCQYNGEDMKIAFNGKFLIEILSNIDSENVVLKLTTNKKAGIFRKEIDNADEDLLMLQMPLIVNL